jgi:S1-C subfamily serine protease
MTDILHTLSDSMANAVEAANHSIVQVDARRRMPATGIVYSADGLIITSHHVVESEDKIHVGLPDGKIVTATLVGRDPNSDLALLRADASSLQVPEWAAVEQVRVGHLVLAVGRPTESPQATLGVISALSHHATEQKYFAQTDVVMYPGFSGGPLVSVTGQVIGLNSSALMQGVSLTVQTPTIVHVVDTLLKHGKMRRGYLGVGIQPAKLPPTVAESLGQKSGALIVSVEANSPAEKAGLFLGDTLVMMGEHRIEDMESLLATLAHTPPGTATTAKIVRGGQIHDVPLTIGERG